MHNKLEESNHWTRTERLPGGIVLIDSLDVRRMMMAADYRRRHPPLWMRLIARWWRWRHRRSKRPVQARVVVS